MVLPVPRFFQCLNTLVGCGLAGPTSSLAFVEAVLGAAARRASFVPSKEHLWRMWSAVVTPLTDAITQVRGRRGRHAALFNVLNDIPTNGCEWRLAVTSHLANQALLTSQVGVSD